MSLSREQAHRRRDELLVDVHPYEDDAVRFVLDGLGVASLSEAHELVEEARTARARLLQVAKYGRCEECGMPRMSDLRELGGGEIRTVLTCENGHDVT